MMLQNNLIRIPPMTHPLSKGWGRQPDPQAILIDDKHAVMRQRDFDQLSEYSCSIPTGVYEGKMWKANLITDEKDGKYLYTWFLRWYDVSDDPNKCAIRAREIIII